MPSLAALEALLQEAGYSRTRAVLFAEIVDVAQLPGMSSDDLYSALVLWGNRRFGSLDRVPSPRTLTKRQRASIALDLKEFLVQEKAAHDCQMLLFDAEEYNQDYPQTMPY